MYYFPQPDLSVGVLAACLRYWRSVCGAAGCAVLVTKYRKYAVKIDVTLVSCRRNANVFFKYVDFYNRKTTCSSQIATWPALALGSRISLLENRISLLDAYTKIRRPCEAG